jgi:predicted ATPase
VLVEQGQVTDGLEQIRRGLTAYQMTGAGLAQAYLLTLLAEALRKADRIEESLATLANAHVWVERHAERWWEAEVYRLRGELLLLQPEPPIS